MTQKKDSESGSQQIEEGGDGEDRAAWGSQLQFVLTLVGFAVGLGNVWRFPYLTYRHGGGAFLIPYVISLIVIGLPLYFMEIAFGQFASLGTLAIWKLNPVMKGVGFASAIVACYVAIYYSVIASWCLFYFFSSMTDTLPWISCNNYWNTPDCYETNQTIPENITNATSASEEFYYNYVLDMSDSINDMGSIRWQLATCLLLVWLIIFSVLLKGIETLGKVSYVISPFPYFLLTCMLIRGVTLPGASTGISFYMNPDFSRLSDSRVWGDAATQIFYSLGVGNGGLITMASFNRFKNNCVRDSLIVPIINCCTSIYAGFVIFSVLGYMAEMKGVPVSEVAAEGPGLVFVVYPEGLAAMPIAPLWSILFFLMMTILGVNPQFSMCEGVISALIDEFPSLFKGGFRPTMLRTFFCVSGFLLGLPMVTQGGFYLFSIVDAYSVGYPLLVVTFMELMAIQFMYGYRRFAEDISMMLGSAPGIYWKATWCCLSPLYLFFIIIVKAAFEVPLEFQGVPYPSWTMILAGMIVAFPILVILAVALGRWCSNGAWRVMKESIKPLPEWGPALNVDRTGRYALLDLELKTISKDTTYRTGNVYVNNAYEQSKY